MACLSGKSARYSRQIPLIGLAGQEKLERSRIACVGVGGLGCPALLSLASAGVGTLGLIDGDRVDVSNLHRQTLFTESDVGRLKVECAQEKLLRHQSKLNVLMHPVFLTPDNGAALLKEYDLILDGTDNYETRYLINRISRELQIPLVSASVFQYEAQVAVFNTPGGACYQCLYPEQPPLSLVPNCGEAGIFGALTGVIGNLQAAEAVKFLLALKTGLTNRLLKCDFYSMEFQVYPIQPRPGCPVCEGKAINSSSPREISNSELKEWMTSKSEMLLLDVREPFERAEFHIGGALFPLKEMLQSEPLWPKDTWIVCYCRSGARSFQAAKWLMEQGYTHTFSLRGGITHWES